MALLDHLLKGFRLSSSLIYRGHHCGVWQVDTSGSGLASFHLVVSGHCWLHRTDGLPPQPLQTGDLLILPHDARHALSPSPQYDDRAGDGEMYPLSDNHPEGTGLLCGFFDLREEHSHPLVRALPDYVIVPADAPTATRLKPLLALIISEAQDAGLATNAVIERLTEALFLLVIRHHLSQSPEAGGLFAALQDSRLARALSALHENPAAPWTVAELARSAGMSRSAFAAHFHMQLKQTPLAYLGHWRMRQARYLLSKGQSMARVAEAVGYQSEAAFTKAFKRITGTPAGALRRRN